MNIINRSDVPGVGTQVVLELYPEDNTCARVVLAGDKEWNRFMAVAKQIAFRLSLPGYLIFERADIKPFCSKGVEVQLSYREQNENKSMGGS